MIGYAWSRACCGGRRRRRCRRLVAAELIASGSDLRRQGCSKVRVRAGRSMAGTARHGAGVRVSRRGRAVIQRRCRAARLWRPSSVCRRRCGDVRLLCCGFEAMLGCRMTLTAGLAVGEPHGAEVGELAVLVVALSAVEAQAEGFIAMLKLQVLQGLGECGHLPVVLETCLHFPTFFAQAFAFAFAIAFGGGRPCARLEQCVDICSDAGHLVQCFVQSPPFAVKIRYLAPQFAICIEEFMCIDGA